MSVNGFVMKKDTTPHALFDLADACAREGRYDEATRLYTQLRDLRPDDDSVLLALAWAYRDGGKRAEAVDCFEILVEKELANPVFTGFAFDELVRVFRSEGEYDRLIRLCERAVAAQPDDVALLFTLGDACSKAGKTVQAIEVFEKLITMEPDGAVYWCALGDALVISGETAKAEAAYDKAAAIDPPGAASFYHRLGCVLMEAGEAGRAEGALMKSLRLSDREPLLHCTLGDVYIKQGRIEEAERSYEYAASINPASRGAFYNRLGNSLRKDRHFREAALAFEKAIEAEPKNPFYYRSLMALCEEAGMDDKARRTWEEACAQGVFSE